jgi:hypothetical protein
MLAFNRSLLNREYSLMNVLKALASIISMCNLNEPPIASPLLRTRTAKLLLLQPLLLTSQNLSNVIQNVTFIPTLIQLLDEPPQKYLNTALANNQVRVQPNPPDHTDPLAISSQSKVLNSTPSNRRRNEITE